MIIINNPALNWIDFNLPECNNSRRTTSKLEENLGFFLNGGMTQELERARSDE